MKYDVIILAGGFGTRLKSVVKDVPKPMAPIGEKPFLEYILDHLVKFNVNKFIFAVGYKREIIQKYFGDEFKSIKINYSIEDTPLGTGGAIKKALSLCNRDDVLIINGDTLFEINFNKFYELHISKHANISVALRLVNNSARYGEVIVDNNNRIISFNEKMNSLEYHQGLINGGSYFINRDWAKDIMKKEVFSFEKDILEKLYLSNYFYGCEFKNYFIDIGVPRDYEKFILRNK